jgi:hypothetical protein
MSSDRLLVVVGSIGPAFDSGSQEREGTGVAVPAHPSPTTAPGSRLSSPGCGRATDGDDAAGRVFSAPAPEASLSERIRDQQEAYQHGLLLDARADVEQLRAKVERLEADARRESGRRKHLQAQVKFWRERAEQRMPTEARGSIVRAEGSTAGDIASGTLASESDQERVEKYARQAGAAETRERAAIRLLCHVMADPSATKSPAWSEAARELIRSMEGRDRA